ncbi:Leucine-rich repeat domain L domain-like [Trinorchestia longiramus]|nr:Leucine-rich repeat domain L domain-like [Trinorchestia longiramus]
MEKRIELERRGRSPSKIEDLNLDNCKSASVIGLSEDWSGLRNLSLINVGLTSLKSFPRLPSLEKLELSDNWISGGLEALTCLPKLMYLNLSGNKITSIDTLKPLKSISTLVNLDLFNCDVVNEEDYRNKVFDLIPSLVYLDGFDKEGNELDDEDDDEDAAGNNRVDGEDEEEDIDDEEDDDDDDDEDEDDEDDEGEDEEDVPLDAIYKNYDPRGDGDYEATEDGEEEDEDLDEEEEEQTVEANTNNCVDADNEGGGGRGKKRKHEGEEDQ